MNRTRVTKAKVHINCIYYIIMIDLVIMLYRKTDKLMMYFFIMGIIGGIISVVHMHIGKKKLTFEIINKKDEIIGKNGIATINLRINNSLSILSPYIYIFMKTTDNLEVIKYSAQCVILEGRGYKDIELPYKAKYSGESTISISHIIIQDLFGMMAVRLKGEFGDSRIAILPESVKLKYDKSFISTMSHTLNMNNEITKKEHMGDFNYELSPYKEGDSMKLVHQKLLARRNIYMVREREEVKGRCKKYVIVLDPRCKNISDRTKMIDKAFTATISLIKEIVNRAQQVIVVYNTQGVWEHRTIYNNHGISGFMDVLARYRAIDEKCYKWPTSYLLDNNIDTGYKVLITPVLDIEYISEIEKQDELGVLTMMKSPECKKTSIQAWHLSDEYEVNKYV